MRLILAAGAVVVAMIAAPAMAQSSSAGCPNRTGCPPTQIPEPGAMLIFAAGAGWLIRRQSRARR